MTTKAQQRKQADPGVTQVICVDGTPVYCGKEDLIEYRDQMEQTLHDLVRRGVLEEAPEVTLHRVDEITVS